MNQVETEPRFRKDFIEMMGTNPSDTEVSEAIAVLGENTYEQRTREYIVNLQTFIDKYSDLIKRIYSISNNGEEPSENLIQNYLQRFAYIPNYKPDDLANEIVSGEMTEREEAAEEHVSEEVQDIEQATASDDLIEKQLKLVKSWEKITGNRIDVYEYIRYHNEGGRLSDAMINDIYEKEKDALLFVDVCTKEHLGRRVNKHEFLEKYIFTYDRPEFKAEVIGTILSSKEYEETMKKHVQTVYHNVFGCKMHTDDVEYAFLGIREKRIPLNDEEISKLIIQVNEALQKIHEQVSAVYTKVLSREPDAEEVREQVNPWRALGGTQASVILMKELYKCLEFHDVVKDNIKKEYKKKHNKEAKPKEVFSILNQILSRYSNDMSKSLNEINEMC
ncbi:hypothetical protein TetV_651 [Tetraselmis virus 1]|uniref:Uncharacterized protein n=1 Tax=Tetraselmis virus 1 TaxID=2060617 RepID=A0A2P0VPA1_9VIRU|nr:hypothetical protein QJ968_gp403 [Tetraselmis virus 1]AUF82733.1 hypothetical protein TetV_651 [Tetraselmis virus 1]